MNRRDLAFLLVACMFLSSAKAQETKPMTAQAKKAAVERIGTLLVEQYVFEDVAKQCAAHINKKLSDGVFDPLKEVSQFAEALTRELQSISHDKHMRVMPAPGRPAGDDTPNPFLDNIRTQQMTASRNFGVARAEIFDGNVGILDIRGFPPTESARATVSAALKVLENVNALIVDVRKNGGGNPDLIRYYCSYFFPAKTHLNSLYWREGNRTQEFWTLDSVDGKRRPELPIFILTSDRTFSGGEEFAYNFKTRKRATLIGETTGGGANPGGMFPVSAALGIFIPTGRAINPVTKSNWEGVGVEPDIPTKADDALERALPLARDAAEKYSKAQIASLEKNIEPLSKALEKGESLLADGKTEEAHNTVLPALEAAVKSGVATEASINVLGYTYLNSEKTGMAIIVFGFNVKQFPQSSNAYDSLGEALMKAGRLDESIRNYRKSVELDPGNENAKKLISKMEKEKKEGNK
jgi:tetratricopeptide (TPR) repeat protein